MIECTIKDFKLNDFELDSYLYILNNKIKNI